MNKRITMSLFAILNVTGVAAVSGCGADAQSPSPTTDAPLSVTLARPPSSGPTANAPRAIEYVNKTVMSKDTVALEGLDANGQPHSSLVLAVNTTGEHVSWTVGSTTLHADRLGAHAAPVEEMEDRLHLVKDGATFDCAAKIADTSAHNDCWAAVDSRAPELEAVRNEWVGVQVDLHGEAAKELTPFDSAPPKQFLPQKGSGHELLGRKPVCGATCYVFTLWECYLAAGIGCKFAGAAACGPAALACGILCGYFAVKPACGWVARKVCQPEYCDMTLVQPWPGEIYGIDPLPAIYSDDDWSDWGYFDASQCVSTPYYNCN
jgi:hypothetical protein